MIVSKQLISGLAASALVAVVGLAYAQSSDGTPPVPATESVQVQPNTPPSTSSDSMSSSTSEPAVQADRN